MPRATDTSATRRQRRPPRPRGTDDPGSNPQHHPTRRQNSRVVIAGRAGGGTGYRLVRARCDEGQRLSHRHGRPCRTRRSCTHTARTGPTGCGREWSGAPVRGIKLPPLPRKLTPLTVEQVRVLASVARGCDTGGRVGDAEFGIATMTRTRKERRFVNQCGWRRAMPIQGVQAADRRGSTTRPRTAPSGSRRSSTTICVRDHHP